MLWFLVGLILGGVITAIVLVKIRIAQPVDLTEIRDTLNTIDLHRSENYGAVTEQLRSVVSGTEHMRAETSNLVKALRTPSTRGRYGEIHLRRVCEISGMVRNVDFIEQAESTDRKLKPDMIVHLPDNRNVVVDAKVPLIAYLDSLEAESEQARLALLKDHSRQLRAHIKALSSKDYWAAFQPAPEFVILYVPGDPFLNAAIEHDKNLVEDALAAKIILASPTTLITLLKTIEFAWKRDGLVDSASDIIEIGTELYQRLEVAMGHVASMGNSLKKTVENYNAAVGSVQSRVAPSARKLLDTGISVKREIREPDKVEDGIR